MKLCVFFYKRINFTRERREYKYRRLEDKKSSIKIIQRDKTKTKKGNSKSQLLQDEYDTMKDNLYKSSKRTKVDEYAEVEKIAFGQLKLLTIS